MKSTLTKEEKQEYGFFFKSMRESIGFTPQEMSDKLGITPQSLSRLERGQINPNTDVYFIEWQVRKIVKDWHKRMKKLAS